MEGGRRNGGNGNDFTDIIFSWSRDDIDDERLYSDKVKKIPDTFGSEKIYQQSFIYPLLEETRADLCSSLNMLSSAPSAEVTGFQNYKIDHGKFLYDVAVDQWRNRFNERCKEPYKTLPGDVLLLEVEAKPHHPVNDMKMPVSTIRALAVVTDISDDVAYFRVKMLKNLELEDGMKLFAYFLISITPSKRIWNALHMSKNSSIIKKVLDVDFETWQNEAGCRLCSVRDKPAPEYHKDLESLESSSDLNFSQISAISSCLQNTQCKHESMVELIWGPPGTGKTKTTSTLLYWLLKMKRRSVVCAPTNVAIKEVASRVLQLLRDSSFYTPQGGRSSKVYCSLGDILLFGTRERLKVDIDAEEIYLDYRIDRIAECLSPFYGWRHCITCMIEFLGNSTVQYHKFLENELTKRIDHESTNEKTLLQFLRERFKTTFQSLENCLYTLCTHIPKSLIGESLFHAISKLVTELKLFETLLHGKNLLYLSVEDLEEAFPCPDEVKPPPKKMVLELYKKRSKCLDELQSVFESLKKLKLPSLRSRESITKFCFKQASVIFCTASNTYKLYSMNIVPPSLLVIDEAAQLRECESMIPLQLPGLKHVILVGDECQLPSLVKSHRAGECGFGRSLFGRLSSLGAPKHLLNMQYRMHPSISCFPNDKYYDGQIDDASNVTEPNYHKNYLSSPMFGPYSFINIANGRDKKGKRQKSFRNSVEVALVLEILNNLYKAWSVSSKKKLSIGVISPYAAQVGAIREKLGPKYENVGEFTMKVMTVDGFQGGEEDIIIISTVRSNSGGLIGFLASPQRTNVALTRARYGLWILGSEKTLTKRPSDWTELVQDAKHRGCFFNVEDEENLANVILQVKKEDDQLEDLLYDKSLLFKDSKWKVNFPDSFCKSFKELSHWKKESVVDHLKKLSNGWRPAGKIKDIDCPKSTQIVKNLKVEDLHIIWTVDVEEEHTYFQFLKFCFIVPRKFIDIKVKHLDSIYEKYSPNIINRCKEKCVEGDLEVPKTWEHPSDYVEKSILSFFAQRKKMGNFPEVASAAKLKGDYLLLDAYLFGKVGNFKDASISIVRSMLYRSLWEFGSKGWPLKQFHGKEELVVKAKSYALLVDEPFYERVRIESAIIVGNDMSSMEMEDLLSASQKAGTVMGEILSSRRVLEGYLSMDDPSKMMSLWNLWKDKIVRVIQSVEFLGTDRVDDEYAEFCLNYFGAFKNCAVSNEEETIHLNPLAEWAASIQDRFLETLGSWVTVKVLDFISAAQKFWCSEIISVGLQMLHYLNTINNTVASNIHIYEVAKFLLDSQLSNCSEDNKSLLLKFIADSSRNHFKHMFPSDWRKSARADVISIDRTEPYLCLLKERIQFIESEKSISYGKLGDLAMIILGSRKLCENNVSISCETSQPWKELIALFCKKASEDINEVSLISKLHGALHDTYTADWRKEADYISPNCFLYLMDRLLILSSCCRKAQFFTTKSGFAEWFTYHDGDYANYPKPEDFEQSADVAFRFVSFVVAELLENKGETRKWIVKSNMDFEEYYPLMVLKLVVLACLLHTNYDEGSGLLFDLLSKKEISETLPCEFYLTLWNTQKQYKRLRINANVLAEAFSIINDPLVVVTFGKNVSTPLCKDAIFVDLTCMTSKEEMWRKIFPETAEVSKNGHAAERKSKVSPSSWIWTPVKHSYGEDLNDNCTKNEMVMELWKVMDTLKIAFDGEDKVQILSFVSSMEVDLDHCLCLFYESLNQYIWGGSGKLLLGRDSAARRNFSGMIDDLKQIYTAFDMMREQKLEQLTVMREILERLLSRRAVMEPLLHNMFQQVCSSTQTSNGKKNKKKKDKASSSSSTNASFPPK